MASLNEIQNIKLNTIKEYLKKHNITTKAKNIKYYCKGEYIQIGDILIKFDLYNNIELLQKSMKVYEGIDKKQFKTDLDRCKNEIEAIKIYNINNIPVLAIYKEKNKPCIDFGGNIQSDCLFNRDYILFPHLLNI